MLLNFLFIVECSFEETNPTLCGWTNLKTDQFDWSIGQGRTASVGTGPTADHTYNDDKGLLFVFLYELRNFEFKIKTIFKKKKKKTEYNFLAFPRSIFSI